MGTDTRELPGREGNEGYLRDARGLGYTRRPNMNTELILKNFGMRIITLTTATVLLALAGCSNEPREQLGDADLLYERAKRAADNGNFRDATIYYERLEARFPSTNAARQRQLDLMYADYKNREPVAASDERDKFLRENPTPRRVDYANYREGLVRSERPPNFPARWCRRDLSGRPPADVRSSFQS